jgi:outer membrane protein assembly factor BamB
MNNKKLTLLTIGVIVFYLCLIIAWHLYDPSAHFTESQPGADHRPAGHVRKADDVLIGEFFMQDNRQQTTDNGQPSTLKGEWPCFRGIHRDNQTTLTPSMKWVEGNFEEMWSVETGEGHAAPVISEGKVYVLDYDEQLSSDALRCFDLLTGKQLWRRWYRVPMKRNHGFSRTIPAVSNGSVVTIGPEGHVMCCDKTTGEMRWSIDMKKRFGTEIPFWYTGQCPLIQGDELVLAPAGKDTLMVGIDLQTGSTLWGTPNTVGFKMSHSSVMPMTLGGVHIYVYIGVGGVCGVSAEEGNRGQLLWNANAWQPSVVAPSPLQISPNQIFLVAGYGAGGALLQVDRQGATWTASIRDSYKASEGMSSEQQTPINYQGTLITILPKDGGGMRERLAMYRPGDLHHPIWTSAADERFGLGPYLVIDDRLFAFKEDGELYVYQLHSSSMTLLRKQRVMEEGVDAWGPMAYADGMLLLRDSKTIKCLKIATNN